MKSLSDYCKAPIDSFRTLGNVTDTAHGPLIYIDRGSRVLAVAHLDTVGETRPRWNKKGDRITCPQLDDRLGVYAIMELLPKMGITVDVLLTDSEEIGESTAQYFRPEEGRYNWAFSFDREGLDCVLYDYSSESLCTVLGVYDYDIGWGSYSDICSLDLGVCGINFGIGYHRQHTRRCYAKMADVRASVERFGRFFADYKDTPLPFEPRIDVWEGYADYDEGDEWGDYDEGDEWKDYAEFSQNREGSDTFDDWDWEYLAIKYGYTDIALFKEEWEEYERTCYTDNNMLGV